MMLQAQTLAGLPGIRHGFFTRQGGVSDGIYASLNGGIGSSDAPEAVTENRTRMAGALGVVPEHLLGLYQIHSPTVVTVEAPWPSHERPRADGFVTRLPGLALGISTADCGPLLFADPQARVIGACHAGWRGAFTGVIEATLDAMERLGADRTRIAASLGPTISQQNYEVGDDFRDRFTAEDIGSARFFRPGERAGHAMFDLPAFIAHRIRQAGVCVFEDLALCTYADAERFYSYRRSCHRDEPDYGRLISAITLAAPSAG
ncbi:MAG TPA: peptidoglycan editing factor PgeF [Xanthobacteraceae bacterium]|nr:peptidoglycan editing factor PgeF [Xanthobacteraceae bacterium]